MAEQLSELGRAALDYVDAGFGVFPLHAGSKTPMTKHGFKDWTDDPESVRAVWGKYPNANIGIACGEPSGNLVVIDVDRDEDEGYDGQDSLDEWERAHGKLPETACAVTGRGGVHYYYRTDGRRLHPDSNRELHIDVRTDGGFVMAAPSVHPNGNAMYWDLHYDDYPIADADENVYALIERIYDHGDGGGGYSKVDAAEFKKGGRNRQLYKMACGLMSQSWDDDAIIASIETYNRMAKEPLPDHEVDKLLRSALKLPKGKSEEFYRGELSPEGGERARTANHVGVAIKLLDEYSACYLDGAPAVFDGLSYRIGWHEVERAVLREWPNSKDRDRKEVVKYLDLTMPRESQSPARYIGFNNGVLDVETMELLSFSPEFRIPNVIPHDWNPDARSEVFDRTMRNIACNDPFIESNLMEFLGLCMYRSGKFAFAAVLLGRQGKTAANGKSTYIDMIRRVLGEDNYSSLSLRALGDRFNQQYLSGKLANLGDDISSEFTDGSSLEVFKKAVAGSKISTDVKNSKGYEFTPYCTMVFSANKFPKMEKLDDGTLRRLFPIRFNAHFDKSDPDFDPDIGEKLAEETAVEAAIVRGVWGLRRVMEQRSPTENDESRLMLHDIETDNSTILQWVEDEFVERDWLEGRETRDAYRRYDQWCGESGVRRPYGKKEFSQTLCDKFGFRIKNTSRDGRSVRVFADA